MCFPHRVCAAAFPESESGIRLVCLVSDFLFPCFCVRVQVGRRTWLCAFDPKTDGCPDMKDSQKFKEFLQDKYEKKKW